MPDPVRLFIAINIPQSVRAAIADATAPLRRAGYPVRWIDPKHIHVTLKFLGDVAADRIDEVEAAVTELGPQSKAFVLPVGGAGAFPTTGNPRVIWIGCDPVPVLELIQHSVERRMQSLGFDLDGRPFRPHLTIGRAKRGARASEFGDMESDLGEIVFSASPLIESIDLMESQLRPTGARYSVRVSSPLSH